MEDNNELVQVITESGVEQSTAVTLQNSFLPFFDKAREWKAKADELIVTDVSQVREMKMAREARLALKDIRVEADKKRKALKEDSLRYGKAVQGVYNVIEYLIVPIEKHLEDQEKFAERLEEKRKAELKEQRDAELQPYLEFVPYQVDTGTLTDAAWNTLLNGAKLQHNAKIEAELKAEAERVAREKAEAEERERIKAENERLKAEAEKAEAARKVAEAKAEAERKAAEEARIAAEKKAQAEREEAERKLAAERKAAEDKARKEHELSEAKLAEERRIAAEKLAAQKAEADRIAAELKAKQDAEQAERERLAKIEADRIAAEKKAAKAPDKTKLLAWVDGMQVTPPDCSTPEGVKVSETVRDKFTAFKAWAKSQIETL